MKKIVFLFVILSTIFLCSCADMTSEEKLRLYEEASNHWEEFFTTDQFSMVMDVEISAKEQGSLQFLTKEKARGEAKICKSPFYLEAVQGEELIIIQEEQGKLYSYMVSSSSKGINYLERNYYGEMNSIDSVEDSYYNEDPLSGLNVENMEMSFEEDVYTFKVNMYDYLQNSDDESVKDIISSLGADEDVFKQFWVTLSMSFSKTTANLKIKMECKYEGINISIIMDTSFDNQKFERIDLQNTPNYVVLHPGTIENVYQFSSVGKVIQIPSFTTNYFKFDLEKGQYGFYATTELGTGTGNWIDDWSVHQLELKLYNENYEEIPMGMGMYPYATNFPEKTFYINEPGTYYLRVWSDISADMDMCINKLNYNTIGFEDTQEVPASYKGKIEGEYDFDVFTINGKEGETLLFKNTGESPIPLMYCEYIDYNNEPFIVLRNIDDEIIINLHEGENKFIISSDFHYYIEPFEYEFVTKKYILENGYEENYEDLKRVTTDFSDLTYLAGNSLPNPRLSFDVETKSIIHFEFQSKDGSSSDIYAIVTDPEGNQYYSFDNNIYELDSGKYIVEINSYSDFHECQIKYTAIEIEDKEINVTLEESSLSELLSDDFPTVKAQNVGRTQKVICNFTLNEDTLIVFEPSVQVYQKDGTPVFYFENRYYRTIYLSQGEYYYLIEGIGSYYYDWSTTYKIGIVNDTLETTSNPNQMKEIKIGEELILKKDWARDEDYLILHVEEDGIYHFNDMIEIYNEDFRYVKLGYDSTSLNAGTYYLIYLHDSSAEINQEVSILITKK
ncbi:MAG: hypothetical protein K2M08_05290 [Anaeroplasmataceae bacterium]|nr:hypothetical protein [Anaeroplasmataceae bacterium]